MLELVARFLVIGALAFGGGQAALPLVERLAVADTGWLTPAQFATGVGLSCATPGPVLILAAFIGYHVAAVPGAVAATAAVFTIPVVLAGFTAQVVAKLKDTRWFQAFGQFAAAAAVGLLGVTLLALARPVVDVHWALLLGSAVVFAAELRGVNPIILIVAAVLLGAAWPLIDDALAGLYILWVGRALGSLSEAAGRAGETTTRASDRDGDFQKCFRNGGYAARTAPRTIRELRPECSPSTSRGSRDLGRGDLVQVDCTVCHHVALLTPDFLLRLGLSRLGCRTTYNARYRWQ